MENNSKVVAAGGLLSSLINTFFKGMDNILDAAAEYQNDMGKLKAVYSIECVDKNDNKHTIKVKLSPIKNKDGIFYVEVDSGDINLKAGSDLNNKTFRINKNNKDAFNAKIDEMLEANGLKRFDAEEVNNDKSTDEDNPEEITLYDQEDGTEYSATIERTEGANDDDVHIKIDTDPSVANMFKERDIESSKVDQAINTWMEDNNLGYDEPEGVSEVNLSTVIQVGLNKVVSDDETVINLTAIKANTDISAAIKVVEEIVADDEFVSSLQPDSNAYFEITEDSDSFDVNETEEFDTSDTYEKLLKETVQIRNNFKSIRWALPRSTTNESSLIDSATWTFDDIICWAGYAATDHTKVAPNLNNFNDLVSLDIFEDPKLADYLTAIKEELDNYINSVDGYYVNLAPDEQGALDGFKNRLIEVESDLEKIINLEA